MFMYVPSVLSFVDNMMMKEKRLWDIHTLSLGNGSGKRALCPGFGVATWWKAGMQCILRCKMHFLTLMDWE